jgi:transcriptional regulator with XRE-family HTH domain
MDRDKTLKELGELIRERRLKLGFSQEELAFRCGFDRTYISLLERGLRNISFTNLLTLSKGLDTTISLLLKDFHGIISE